MQYFKRAYSLVVEFWSPKPAAEVQILVGPLLENSLQTQSIFFYSNPRFRTFSVNLATKH